MQLFLNRNNVETKKSSAHDEVTKVHGGLAMPAEVNEPVESET